MSTHLLVTADDKTTFCGIKVNERGSNADLPQMLARYVQAHRDGRARVGNPPLVLCDTCQEILDLLG